ncbi:unnamed protein product [Linum tenue]|uniref:Aldose 1-epimerase n=1 Tax=Linum tenue TaxID=586396 RepID=A0AAV0IRP8_9ROSI|nr:unnamed protein product [Linum tenue]
MTKLSVFFTLFLFQALSFASHGHCKAEDDEVAVKQYELQKGNLKLGFTNYGATLNSVTFPDRHGKLADISLGFDNPEDYKNDTVYFGNIVGRVANRIGGAGFKLNGTYYKLPANDHNNTLHGGPKGFSDVVWKVTELVQTSKQAHITFSYDSFDGEEGFSGRPFRHSNIHDPEAQHTRYQNVGDAPDQSHPCQPGLPRLLEPRRARQRDDPEPHNPYHLPLLHSGGRPAHPHGPIRHGEGHTLRFHDAPATDREQDRRGRGRVRHQLRDREEDRAPGAAPGEDRGGEGRGVGEEDGAVD